MDQGHQLIKDYIFSSAAFCLPIVEDEIYWRGINESDPTTDAICNQTSGHTKYHTAPIERYGQEFSTDTP